MNGGIRLIKKKGIGILFFCIGFILLVGCSQKESYVDYVDNDKNQLLEVMDSKNNIIRQTTDNRVIAELVSNEKIEEWIEVEKLPLNTEKLYVFYSYEQITESIFINETDSNISSGQETLYRSDEAYYIKDVDDDGDITYEKIPDSVGSYLVEFAREKSDIRDKQDIFSEWENTTQESDTDKTAMLGEKIISYIQEKSDNKQDNTEMTNDQKIEIIYLDHTITITDSDKIVDFYKELDIEKWNEINKPLSDENKICTIKFYQPERKTRSNSLSLNNEIIIYQDDDEYWVDSTIPANNSGNNEMKTYYKVSSQIVEYLSGLF